MTVDQEWYGVALGYAREYGELRASEELRDREERRTNGDQPLGRFHAAYRAREPFRACYQALKEAGYGGGAAEEARRLADKAYAQAVA